MLRNHLSKFKFSDHHPLIRIFKLQVKIMTVFSEKIPNLIMVMDLHQLLTLFTSEFLDTTYIIPKLMLILLFSELFLLIILEVQQVLEQIVSQLLILKVITGNFVLLMELLLPIGFVLYLKPLDYHVLKKEKMKKVLKRLKLFNH